MQQMQQRLGGGGGENIQQILEALPQAAEEMQRCRGSC